MENIGIAQALTENRASNTRMEEQILKSKGWLRQEEKDYIDSLISSGEYSKWVDLLSRSIMEANSNGYKGCADYICTCIKYATAPVEKTAGVFTITICHGEHPVYSCFSESQHRDFEIALCQLSARIVEYDYFYSFFSKVKKYFLSRYGSLAPLEAYGFSEVSQTKSAEDQLRDCCIEAMELIPKHEKNIRFLDGPVRKVLDKLYTLDREARDASELSLDDFYYSLAKQEEIRRFFCLYDASATHERTAMLVGCVLNEDRITAFECMNLLLETNQYPNYHELHGWEKGFQDTVEEFANSVDEHLKIEKSSQDELMALVSKLSGVEAGLIPNEKIDKISRVARLSVELIERVPYLWPKTRSSIKAKLRKFKQRYY